MAYEILKNLLEINTIKDKENEKIRDYIKTFLTKYNFTCQEIGKNKAKVLVATRNNPTLAFVCHTDTVNDSIEWTRPPLTLTTDDTYLYGLGVSDMKGGIAALLEAVSMIEKTTPCMICFTYDEETNFAGIQELVKENITLPKTLLFTEPTDLVPVIANKGCIEYQLTFRGKSAHSSTPALGENAIDKAIDLITELKKFANTLQQEKNSLFEVSETTYNLSSITGGKEINKVPEECKITFDFRTIKKEHNDQIQQKVIELASKYQAEVELLNNLNAAVNEDEKSIKQIEFITKKQAIGLNYSTEASFFPTKKILILGPGPVTAHQKDEKITKESYETCKKLYQSILETFQ